MILDYIPTLIFEILKVFYNSEQLKTGGNRPRGVQEMYM